MAASSSSSSSSSSQDIDRRHLPFDQNLYASVVDRRSSIMPTSKSCTAIALMLCLDFHQRLLRSDRVDIEDVELRSTIKWGTALWYVAVCCERTRRMIDHLGQVVVRQYVASVPRSLLTTFLPMRRWDVPYDRPLYGLRLSKSDPDTSLPPPSSQRSRRHQPYGASSSSSSSSPSRPSSSHYEWQKPCPEESLGIDLINHNLVQISQTPPSSSYRFSCQPQAMAPSSIYLCHRRSPSSSGRGFRDGDVESMQSLDSLWANCWLFQGLSVDDDDDGGDDGSDRRCHRSGPMPSSDVVFDDEIASFKKRHRLIRSIYAGYDKECRAIDSFETDVESVRNLGDVRRIEEAMSQQFTKAVWFMYQQSYWILIEIVRWLYDSAVGDDEGGSVSAAAAAAPAGGGPLAVLIELRGQKIHRRSRTSPPPPASEVRDHLCAAHRRRREVMVRIVGADGERDDSRRRQIRGRFWRLLQQIYVAFRRRITALDVLSRTPGAGADIGEDVITIRSHFDHILVASSTVRPMTEQSIGRGDHKLPRLIQGAEAFKKKVTKKLAVRGRRHSRGDDITIGSMLGFPIVVLELYHFAVDMGAWIPACAAPRCPGFSIEALDASSSSSSAIASHVSRSAPVLPSLSSLVGESHARRVHPAYARQARPQIIRLGRRWVSSPWSTQDIVEARGVSVVFTTVGGSTTSLHIDRTGRGLYYDSHAHRSGALSPRSRQRRSSRSSATTTSGSSLVVRTRTPSALRTFMRDQFLCASSSGCQATIVRFDADDYRKIRQNVSLYQRILGLYVEKRRQRRQDEQRRRWHQRRR